MPVLFAYATLGCHSFEAFRETTVTVIFPERASRGTLIEEL